MIHVSTVCILIPNAETNGRDGQMQRNRRLHPITNRAESAQWRVRVWYWAYHPIIKHVSIHHSYLAHILIFLMYSTIFRQTPYSSWVMVTLSSLDFYRKLSMAKQVNSRSLNMHISPSISYSRARRETCQVGSTQITWLDRVKPMHKQ